MMILMIIMLMMMMLMLLMIRKRYLTIMMAITMMATPHPKAVGASGLLLDYRPERAYCFPPPRLIPRLLAVLLRQQASAVVVVPHRPSAPWWPLWLQGTTATIPLHEAVVPYLRSPRSFVSPRLVAGRFCGASLRCSV
jgi:hypothetical protein